LHRQARTATCGRSRLCRPDGNSAVQNPRTQHDISGRRRTRGASRKLYKQAAGTCSDTRDRPVSLGPLLQSLGLALVIVEDLAALKRIEKRLTKRRRPLRDASDMLTATKKRQRPRFPKGPEFASFMNARRTLKLDASQRSAIARKAAQARWRRPTVRL